MTTHLNPVITRILARIPNTHRICDIDVAGRNVIITGANGSGKTQLLRKIYNSCVGLISGSPEHADSIRSNITSHENTIKTMSPSNPSYDDYANIIEHLKAKLEDALTPPVTLENTARYSADYKRGAAVLTMFEATRQANIPESPGSVSRERLILKSSSHGADPTALFEEYLVSLKTSQAYAESPSIGNDLQTAFTIERWFIKLEEDFKSLFEDSSLRIVFDHKRQCFWIHQQDKKQFRLQTLSSGYSSILAVYASLLMKTELSDVLPVDIYGVVIIDEIDAHLHVSLQRKILSFLSQSFPKIQFIVTTHSPFVVSSVSNAVIYDITQLKQADDLSMYSYESVLSGLFNTPPISKLVTDKLTGIYDLLDSTTPDLQLLASLIREVAEYESMLDDTSAMHLKRARLHLHKLVGSSPSV